MKTPTGYEYQIVRKGSSTEPIPVNSYVFFSMSLTEKDSVLQSSAKTGKPSVIKIEADMKNFGQLKPLVDLMATLHEGDSLEFYFPIDSFERKPPGFEKFTEPLVYHVGVLNVMDQAEFQAHSDSISKEQEKVKQVVRDRMPEIESKTKATWTSYKKGELKDQIQTTASGLKYIMLEPGDDGTKPAKGEQVSVHYYGMLDSDGVMFDSSFKGGQPYQFPVGVGQVIPGWDEGIMLLNKGAKAILFIPASLGYGAAGSPPVIPANADLVFYVELEK
ncbi:MAG TPA: FKBP-type peptidyl-prolyl cis-trans isomerase [Saprospiraceae bacterium]|nr:FKBP-type peptidyl-prolyl cis-trans isomerase [Saprospiraceae bacterium]